MAQLTSASQRVSVKVLDDRGHAVADASVSFASGPVALPDIAALTDGAGTSTLSAPAPGRYRIAAGADGFAPATEDVTISGTALTVTFRLRRA